jgi:hypothetical protein
MEIILKSNNQESLNKIITLAKKLNVLVETKGDNLPHPAKEALKSKILNFKANGASSFGDAAQWEKAQREDRFIPNP